jgi:chromosome segregation ATPase
MPASCQSNTETCDARPRRSRPEAEALDAELDQLHDRLSESNAQFAALLAQIAQVKAEYSVGNHDAVSEAQQAVQRDYEAIERLKARRQARRVPAAAARDARARSLPSQRCARRHVVRPRERRECRHVARATSSGDSGSDDGPEPPPFTLCGRWGS